jgi:hypothetical protein
MAIEHIKRLDVEKQPWKEELGGLVYRKYLYNDEATGVHFSYNKSDPVAKGRSVVNFHDAGEEVFYIDGDMLLYDDYYVRYHYKKGCYLYRPGGWVHGPLEFLRTSIRLERSEGLLELKKAQFVDLGRNPSESNLNKALDGRGLIKCLDSESLPWIPGDTFLKDQAWVLGGADPTKISFKVLSMDRYSKAATVIAKLHPGFVIPKPGYCDVTEDAFVLEGEMKVDGEVFGRHFFYYRPKGVVSGRVESAAGCELYMRVGGPLQRHESEAAKIDKTVA